MKPVVMDTSVIISWFMPDEIGGEHAKVLEKIGGLEIHVPPVFEYELMNVLLTAERKGRLKRKSIEMILETIRHYPISVEPAAGVCRENIGLLNTAVLYHLTIYDASYLELAVQYGSIPLLTYDKPLSLAAKKLNIPTSL